MITNISLKNFKCFDDLDIDVANLTLFMGINGVGKSSVIQSLLLQRQSLFDKRVDFAQKVAFDGGLVNLKTANQTRNALSESDEIDLELIEDDELFSTVIKGAAKEENTCACTHGENYASFTHKSALFNDSFVYLYADRTIPKDVYSADADDLTNSRLGNRSGHLTASYLFNSLQNADIRDVAVEDLVVSEGSKSLLINTNEWMSRIMSVKTSIQVSEKSEREVSLAYIRESQKIGAITVSPLNMPFGNSYLLPIIVAVLSAPAGSLIVVENPEAHLHPSAQTRLGQFFAQAAHSGIQLFIETHSDHLVNGIRNSVKNKQILPSEVALHFISEDEDEPLVHRDDRILIQENGELNKWPRLFLDEWERSLYELSK